MAEALRVRVRPELDAPTLLIAFHGWNDAGEAATTAVQHLSQSLRAVPLAEIDGEDFYDFTVQRPVVSAPDGVVRDIHWPRVAFRYASLPGLCDLVLAAGPEPHFHWRRFTDMLSEYVAELGVKRVVLLGAYLADVLYSLPVQVTGLASRPEQLVALDVNASRYEGPTGILGVLGDRFARDGLDVVSLWAGLPHYITVTPNPRGALALTHKLSGCLGLPIDDSGLCADAAEFEERIAALVAADPELLEYVRQLKRRGFAQ